MGRSQAYNPKPTVVTFALRALPNHYFVVFFAVSLRADE